VKEENALGAFPFARGCRSGRPGFLPFEGDDEGLRHRRGRGAATVQDRAQDVGGGVGTAPAVGHPDRQLRLAMPELQGPMSEAILPAQTSERRVLDRIHRRHRALRQIARHQPKPAGFLWAAGFVGVGFVGVGFIRTDGPVPGAQVAAAGGEVSQRMRQEGAGAQDIRRIRQGELGQTVVERRGEGAEMFADGGVKRRELRAESGGRKRMLQGSLLQKSRRWRRKGSKGSGVFQPLGG